MGNIRSREKLKKSYDWDKANKLFLKFSFHDKLRTEIVHTKDTEAMFGALTELNDVLGKLGDVGSPVPLGKDQDCEEYLL